MRFMRRTWSVLASSAMAFLMSAVASHAAVRSEASDEEAAKKISVKCAELAYGQVKFPWMSRAQAFVPVRFWDRQRAWFPRAARLQLQVLYSRLPRATPKGLMLQLENLFGSPWPTGYADYLADQSDVGVMKDLGKLRQLRDILERIARLTDQSSGPDSASAGLAQFALSVFYGAHGGHREAIETGDLRTIHVPGPLKQDAFVDAAEASAHHAADVLTKQGHPMSWWARLHLVKQLLLSARTQSNVNFPPKEGPEAPCLGFDRLLEDVRLEGGSLRDQLVDARLSEETKHWMNLHIELYLILADELELAVAARQDQRFDGNLVANSWQLNERQITHRLESLLRSAMSNPLVFETLVQQGPGGFLSGLLVHLHKDYRARASEGVARARSQELMHLLLSLHQRRLSVAEAYRQLDEVGLSPIR